MQKKTSARVCDYKRSRFTSVRRFDAFPSNMRWLLGTATSILTPISPITPLYSPRHPPPALFGDLQPQLAEEEFRALAGIWRVDLQLYDGDLALSLHLAAPEVQPRGDPALSMHQESDEFPSEGRVYTVDENLPSLAICPALLKGRTLRAVHEGWTSAHWSANRLVRAGEEGDDKLRLTLRMGSLCLEGRGQRAGLRCRTFVGRVYEEDEYKEPSMIGRFSMRLSLPLTTDASALEQRYQRRIASRPPPPLAYPRASFIGRWRLLLQMKADEADTPLGTSWAYFPVELFADGSWRSMQTDQTLAGSWGMLAHDESAGELSPSQHATCDESQHATRDGASQQPPPQYARPSASRQAGSSLWLTVDREQCSETHRGVAGLPVDSDFTLSGQPVLETEGQQLAAELTALLLDEGVAGAAGAGGGLADALLALADRVDDRVADRVDGRLSVATPLPWMGSVEHSYFGRFSLVRESALAIADELHDQCDLGHNVACDVLSREEEAKRAWLAKQAQADELHEQCDRGHDVACDVISKEEQAKRAWLARLGAPTWGGRATQGHKQMD